MCGIVGGIGNADFRSYILGGLKKLDYRGYDSAGIAYRLNGKINLIKTQGTVEKLDALVPDFQGADIAIGHTRWATHGVPNEINAHPQVSMNALIHIVHNGVIENFRALKTKLRSRGYTFRSQTDTEVIADLLEYHYIQNGKKDFIKAIENTMDELEGSYATAIILDKEERLYFMKKASPLLIGVSEQGHFLASDCVPMMHLTDKFVDLDDMEYGYITKSELHLFKNHRQIPPKFVKRDVDDFRYDISGYEHFMLKEIEEAPYVLRRLADNYCVDGEYTFNPDMLESIRKADEVVFIACGTSYYASLFGVEFLNYMGKRATAYIASEWAYRPQRFSKKPLYIFLSQSGETADIVACQKIVNAEGLKNIAITNSKGSTLDRKATYGCLIYAGLEVGVAATKTYMAQVGFLSLLLGALTGSHSAVTHLDALIDAVRDIIERKEAIHELAKEVIKAPSLFYIGRGSDYNAALECALKLKEISYIHAEAYPGGELKHGPIALIEKDTPVIGLISSPAIALQLRNNIEELKARGAKTFIVCNASLSNGTDAFLTKEIKPYLAPLTKVVFGQYFSYYVAYEKGLPIDKPRNLAKAVTVE